MPTLESLHRQIETATDLSSVVSTMKTLAAVSIHQYERAVEALADYSRTVEMGFQIALPDEPFRVESGEPAGRTAAIVFGSDQGMCGQFNEEIVSFIDTQAQPQDAKSHWLVLAVGSRVQGRLLDAGFLVEDVYDVPTSVSDITNFVQQMLLRIEQLRTEADLSRLYVCYNRRTSASSFEPRQIQLLPMDPQRLLRWRDEPWQSTSLPMFVSDRQKLLLQLVQHDLFVTLFRACAESLASENASRIAAMQAAEKNIEERLEELSGAFNHLRQTEITEELLDVITGFEALSKATKHSSS